MTVCLFWAQIGLAFSGHEMNTHLVEYTTEYMHLAEYKHLAECKHLVEYMHLGECTL